MTYPDVQQTGCLSLSFSLYKRRHTGHVCVNEKEFMLIQYVQALLKVKRLLLCGGLSCFTGTKTDDSAHKILIRFKSISFRGFVFSWGSTFLKNTFTTKTKQCFKHHVSIDSLLVKWFWWLFNDFLRSCQSNITIYVSKTSQFSKINKQNGSENRPSAINTTTPKLGRSFNTFYLCIYDSFEM